MVAVILLAVIFDIWYLLVAVVVTVLAVYVWFTFAVTEWRVKLRREMNDPGHGCQSESHRQSAELSKR